MLTVKKYLNATQLKLIAMALMVLDHIHEFFSYTNAVPIWFTWLGRLVFPIFMFTMVEGFYYTKSREKYLIRLYLGSVLMGVFNFVLVKAYPRPDEMPIMNNIFSTFFMTTFHLYFIEKIKEYKHSGKNILIPIMLFIIPIAVSILLPYTPLLPSPMFVEGGPILVILGIIMYYSRPNRKKQIFIYIVFSFLLITGDEFSIENLLYHNYQWMMAFSVIFMLMYNGEKGKGYKYLFYAFYPIHIYVLYILSVCMFNLIKI